MLAFMFFVSSGDGIGIRMTQTSHIKAGSLASSPDELVPSHACKSFQSFTEP